MAKPFKVKKGELVARLGGQERQVLAFVCDELTDLLADPVPPPEIPGWAQELGLSGVGDSRPTPDDPVVARLLPDAYDDPEIRDDARAWLAFLADARLMLGTRLEVTEGDELVPTDDPEHNLYLYLGYLQQSLVEELMGG